MEKLEADLAAAKRDVTFPEVYAAALRRLSPRDSELVKDVKDYRVRPERETHAAAWNRMQIAIREATRELRYPVLITGYECCSTMNRQTKTADWKHTAPTVLR